MMDEGEKPPWRFFAWIQQRTTLLGLGIILAAVIGVWLDAIDDGATGTLLVFGCGFLLPEDWPIARQIISFIAPILVRQIHHHHPPALTGQPHEHHEILVENKEDKDKKHPFS